MESVLTFHVDNFCKFHVRMQRWRMRLRDQTAICDWTWKRKKTEPKFKPRPHWLGNKFRLLNLTQFVTAGHSDYCVYDSSLRMRFLRHFLAQRRWWSLSFPTIFKCPVHWTGPQMIPGPKMIPDRKWSRPKIWNGMDLHQRKVKTYKKVHKKRHVLSF